MNEGQRKENVELSTIICYDISSLKELDTKILELVSIALSKIDKNVENSQLSIPLEFTITYQEDNEISQTVVRTTLRLTTDRSHYLIHPNTLCNIIANHFPENERGEIKIFIRLHHLQGTVYLTATLKGNRAEIRKSCANSDAKNTLSFEPWQEGIVPINFENTRTPFEKVYSDIYTVIVNCISRYLEAGTFPENNVFRVELFQNGAVSKILDFNVGCITKGIRKKSISDVVICGDTQKLRSKINNYWLENQYSSSSDASILVRVIPNPKFE